MKCNSKTLLAVFAVCLMLGGALLPFASDNSNGITVQQSDNQDGEFTLFDLIDMFSSMGHDVSEQTSAGSMFIPVDGGEIIVAPTGSKTFDSEEQVTATMHLGGDSEYTFSGNGKIVVENGGKLILSDINIGSSLDDSFTLKNSDYGLKDVILLKNGALVYFLGIWFQFVCVGDQAYPLVSLGHYTVAKLGNEHRDNNKRDLYIDVGSCDPGAEKAIAGLKIFQMMHIYASTDSEEKEVEINGLITASAGSITFSDCETHICITNPTTGSDSDKIVSISETRLSLEIKTLNVAYTMWDPATSPTKAAFTINANGSGIINLIQYVSTSSEGSFQASVYRIDDPGKDDLEFSVADFKYEGECSMIKAGSVIDKTANTHKISLANAQIYGDAGVSLSRDGTAKNTTIDIDDVLVKLSGLSAVMKTYGDASSTKYTSFEFKSLEFSAYASAGVIDCINGMCVISSATVDLSNVKFNFDPESLSIGAFNVVFDISCPMMIKNTLHFVFDLKDIGADGNGLYTSFTVNLSTMLNGLERNMNLTVKNLSVGGSTLADIGVKCDLIRLTNGIPFNEIVVGGLSSGNSIMSLMKQSFVGTIEIKGLEASIPSLSYGGIKTDSFKIDLDVRENGIVDHFNLYSDQESYFMITPVIDYMGGITGFSLNISSEYGLNGYLKNVGEDKRAFKFTPDNDGACAISITVSFMDGALTLKTVSGTADFSNGGLIPAILVIGEYAKFIGNDTSAMHFEFQCSIENLSGTVSFDFSDGYAMEARHILYYTSDGQLYLNDVNRIHNGDCGGYKIVFDLKNLDKATIYANSGCTLNTGCEISDQIHFVSGTVTPDKAQITIDNDKNRQIWIKCERNSYHVYSSYASTDIAEFGETVGLQGTYDDDSGYVLIGWYDGNNNITGYINKDSNSVYAWFDMPARDVTLVPIFAEKGTVSEDNVVETSATAVVVPTEQIKDQDLTIKTEGAIIKIDETTVSVLKDAAQNDITINVTQLIDADAKSKSSVVQNSAVFNIDVLVDGEKFDNYSEMTSFEVTLTVFFEGDIKDFKISYVDELGHKSDVKLTGYKTYGNNMYDVKFTVNHFSEYMVEPVYKEKFDVVALGLVAAVIIIALVAGVYQYCRPGKN